VEFRWNEWNVDHIAKHGVEPEEAEYVVERARSPYPRKEDEGKYRMRGRTEEGQWLQVIYIFSPEYVAHVIHARPLTDREKKQERRHRR